MRILLAFIFCAFSAHILVAQTAQPSTTPLSCACGSSSTAANFTPSEFQARRGIPAFIVLRGQRFGGTFGEAVGGTRSMDIPFFPNAFGSQQFGGGITVQTAMNYGAIIGPFKAGVPTVATIIAEIVDVFGDVVTTATSTHASLELSNLVPEWRKQWLSTNSTVTTATNGRFEWSDVEIEGLAGTTLTLRVRHSTLATCGCAAQIALQGGYPFNATFATQNRTVLEGAKLYPGASGPFAAPGVMGAGRYGGSLRDITVGSAITFPYADAAGQSYNSTAVIITDRYGNFASFSTGVTIGLVGGNPPVNQVTTPLIGNVANSVVTWGMGQFGREVGGEIPSRAEPGIARTVADLNQAALGTMIPLTQPPYSMGSAITNNVAHVSPALGANGVGYPPTNNPQPFQNVATFPYLQIWGATSSNVELQVVIYPILGMHRVGAPVATTSAIVDLLPGAAIGIAPVLIPDKYDGNRLKRMPSRFVIGQSNAADPQTWFYVQAVDEFGNRVDRGANAYNGGTATITFYTSEQGLPRAAGAIGITAFPPNGFQFLDANDPNVKANTQRYSAMGTSAVAVNGLFTFNNFTPLGPPSIDAVGNDVVLTFEDYNLPGVYACRSSCASRRQYQPMPPITTATTTFLAPTSVRVSGVESSKISIAPNPASHNTEQVMVQYRLQAAASVALELVSMQGVVVARFDAGFQAQGEQVFMLPVGDVPSGIYAVRISAGGHVQTAMMTVMR